MLKKCAIECYDKIELKIQPTLCITLSGDFLPEYIMSESDFNLALILYTKNMI